jgi:hypothetical protein
MRVPAEAMPEANAILVISYQGARTYNDQAKDAAE